MKNIIRKINFILISILVLLTNACKKENSDLVAAELKHKLSISDALTNALVVQMGSILREEWDNVPGNDISQIPLQSSPTSSNQITSLEGPLNTGFNYGARVRGYIYPPTDGNYTFWIAADDSGELWLSTDDNPANKIKIANTISWTDNHQWDKYSSQKSAAVTLQANHKYYIEILHKQGQGGGNLSVQWMLPDNSIETPIPGSRLSPFIDQTLPNTGTILREEWDNVSGNDISSIPLQNTPTTSGTITTLEGPLNTAYNYGARIRGYVYPPEDGNYTFWIAADDSGELWLSADDNPANKVKIASTAYWTDSRQWTKYSSQKSVQITLQANHKYYIEILHKQGGGGGNLAVQWTLPDATTESPIPGKRFAPYVASTATSTNDTPASTVSGTGNILREEWDNINANSVGDIPVQNTPTTTASIISFEGPLNSANTYGERIRGYIYPPISGNYTFWIASDDAGQLMLSTDDNPANKVKIAEVTSWTNYRQWDKFSSQKSAPVSLLANHKYYIEALHAQGYGGANLSVQWMLPNNSLETPIPGSRLSPYTASATSTTPTTATINPTSGSYVASGVMSLNGAHDITISGKSIAGGNVPAITLTNCYNIHITQNRLINSTDVGVHLYNCSNITIDYNYFTNVSTGVYAEQSPGGGIIVNYNQFLNMKGPFPRGQFVQFNTVSGANSSISYNKGENIFGQSYPEDAINLYQSSGTPSSPIKIVGNWIRGGGPSASGGGIMLGDNGGSYLSATDNILVDPGQYGMAIAGGDHNEIINNKIYGRSQSFTNVGLYVNSIGGYNETNSKIMGNLINFFNATNYNNNWWLAPGVQKPTGWDDGGNVLGAPINSSILPAVIITNN